MKILRLDKTGNPTAWLNREDAATLIVREQVLWSMGDVVQTLRGGYNRAGERSCIELPSILACAGRIDTHEFVPSLSNRLLFARDHHLCLYCGESFASQELSRDHIQPTSRGGRDEWTNCVSACRRCNNRKGNRTPDEAGMELLAIPFAPNRHEYFFLANRDVRGDQMDFLKARFSRRFDLPVRGYKNLQ